MWDPFIYNVYVCVQANLTVLRRSLPFFCWLVSKENVVGTFLDTKFLVSEPMGPFVGHW